MATKTVKKSPAKKAAPKKTVAKKAPAKKSCSTARKPTAKKTATKKTTPKAKKKSSRQRSRNKEPTKETYPHFRMYKKSNHPALIVAEHSDDEYKFKKVTHQEKEGRHKNEKIEPNPNPNDPKAMYVGKRVRHDKKSFFGHILTWKYPKK